MTRGSAGPAESVLSANVARRYYLLGESKVQIAHGLGINRFKVARLLELARDTGMVRIEIVSQQEIDLDRSVRLQEAYGLRRAIVAHAVDADIGAASGQLGAVAAELLGEVLSRDDVLGLPWSRSVDRMTTCLREMPRVDVVQLSGALDVDGHDASAVGLVRRAARATGGTPFVFYAPLLMDDAAGAATVRRDAQVARVLQEASRVTFAIMGVGAWAVGLSTVFDALSPRDREEASAAGVVGEMAGVMFDAGGSVVDSAVAQRVVTISPEHLLGIRDVLGIAAGPGKAEAVRAALAGRLINAIVTDASLADALLSTGPVTPQAGLR